MSGLMVLATVLSASVLAWRAWQILTMRALLRDVHASLEGTQGMVRRAEAASRRIRLLGDGHEGAGRPGAPGVAQAASSVTVRFPPSPPGRLDMPEGRRPTVVRRGDHS